MLRKCKLLLYFVFYIPVLKQKCNIPLISSHTNLWALRSPLTPSITIKKVRSPQFLLPFASFINSPRKLQPPFPARTKEVQQKGQFIPLTHRPNPITKDRFLSILSQSPLLPQVNTPSKLPGIQIISKI